MAVGALELVVHGRPVVVRPWGEDVVGDAGRLAPHSGLNGRPRGVGDGGVPDDRRRGGDALLHELVEIRGASGVGQNSAQVGAVCADQEEIRVRVSQGESSGPACSFSRTSTFRKVPVPPVAPADFRIMKVRGHTNSTGPLPADGSAPAEQIAADSSSAAGSAIAQQPAARATGAAGSSSETRRCHRLHRHRATRRCHRALRF